MPKRKRDFEEPAPNSSKGSAKQQRLDHKLETGTRKIAHAFKVAKGFERQKLGRREKTARAEKNDKDSVRIESEIAALKTLDTLASAQLFIYKTLSKIKAVAASELFVDLLSNPPALQHDTAAQNIHARLCNSKPVKEALAATVEDVLQAAHIQAQKKSSFNRATQPIEPRPKLREEELSEEEAAGNGVLSDFSGDEAYARYEHRLALSDDEDEPDSDVGDISKLERQLRSEVIRDDGESISASDEASDFDGFESADYDALGSAGAAPRSSKPRTSAKWQAERPKSSMILPSLTMGYISASDGSEVEEIDVAPRKNRPGQRARQAIWEKKYGAKAKHLKDSANNRDKGWDAKRGATGNARHGSSRSFAPRRGGLDTEQAVAEPKPRKKDDTGVLHPSWVAAKQAKEKKAGIPVFTGKKISFD